MNIRRVTASGLALIGLVAAAAVVLGPDAATGAGRHVDVWKGQTVSTRADALRVGGAKAANTLTITNVPAKMGQVDIANDGMGPGDYFYLSLKLYNQAGTTKIGRGAVRCDLGYNSQTCNATLFLFKQGQITVTGTQYFSRSKFALAITGGTDKFRGAGGLVRVVQDSTTQFLMLHFT